MDELALDIAMKNAARGVSRFFNGHSWSDEYASTFYTEVDQITHWWRGELEATPEALLPKFKRLAEIAERYAGGTDLYAYEASYIVWSARMIEQIMSAGLTNEGDE